MRGYYIRHHRVTRDLPLNHRILEEEFTLTWFSDQEQATQLRCSQETQNIAQKHLKQIYTYIYIYRIRWGVKSPMIEYLRFQYWESIRLLFTWTLGTGTSRPQCVRQIEVIATNGVI